MFEEVPQLCLFVSLMCSPVSYNKWQNFTSYFNSTPRSLSFFCDSFSLWIRCNLPLGVELCLELCSRYIAVTYSVHPFASSFLNNKNFKDFLASSIDGRSDDFDCQWVYLFILLWNEELTKYQTHQEICYYTLLNYADTFAGFDQGLDFIGLVFYGELSTPDILFLDRLRFLCDINF